MFKKILAILVMIFSILGAILCAGGILGTWVAQSPARTTINAAIDTANSYVGLAGESVQNVRARIAGVRGEIENTQQRLRDMTPEQRTTAQQQLRDAAQQRFGPGVAAVRDTAQRVSTGLVTLNQSLETVNRIPGVNAPTFSDELAAINTRLETLDARLQAFQSALADVNFDGERVNAAARQVVEEIAGVESRLDEWNARLRNASVALDNAKGTLANALSVSAVFVTLFFSLFLAGQISLFAHALAWFRKR